MNKLKKIISIGRAFSIIQKPLMTEKSTNLNQYNQYSFLVSKNSNSIEIKQAIENFENNKKRQEKNAGVTKTPGGML